MILILATVALGVILAIPNFFEEDTVAAWPEWLPKNQMVLGLDLQGGSHILLRVEQEGLIEERMDTLRDDIVRILRDERIARQSLSTTDLAVQVRVRKVEDTQNAVTALQQLVVPISNSILGGVSAYETELTSTDDGLITLTLTSDGLDLRLRSAVSQSIEVIRRRVDELGTTEPLIQRQGVEAVVGYISSGSCLAVAPVAEELKTFTVLFDCGTPRIFEDADYTYVFRTAAHATPESVGAARYVSEKFPETTKIQGINQNYAWGQDSWRDFSTAFCVIKKDAEQLEPLWPKLFQGQYGPEISRLSVSPGRVRPYLSIFFKPFYKRTRSRVQSRAWGRICTTR